MNDYNSVFRKITNAILIDYLEIFYIDLETNQYLHFSKSDKRTGSVKGDDFFMRCLEDAREFVLEEDRERFITEFTKENIINTVGSDEYPQSEYRLIIDGEPSWYGIRIISGEYCEKSKYAIIGVKNILEEKLKSEELLAAEQEKERLTQIASALANIFDSIYYIDLEDNSFVEFSSSAQYKKIRTMDSGNDFFIVAKPMIRRFIHPNDEDKIVCIYDKKTMLKAINTHKGAYTTEYRFIIKGQIYYCRAGIRITKDCSHVLLTVTNLGLAENIEEKLQKSERLSMTYSQIAERLAEHYDNIYYVNAETDEYMIFSSTRLLSDLDKAERKYDFFENAALDIDKFVYTDDRAILKHFIEKERLLGELYKHKSGQIEYRLLINDEPSYVRLTAMLTQDNENILICVENINQQVLNYKKLARRATLDELTGAKNKNSYKEYEEKLNEQIKKDPGTAFAILVCDINNLKMINDTMGHSAGDEYIKSSCALICNLFVHSPVFRVGGDEFIAVLKGDDYKDREKLFGKFRNAVEHNSTLKISPARPVIASGMCVFSGKHTKVEDVFNEADRMMYENKARLKKGMSSGE